eukprot:TRINITY_DN1473_c0_g1_i1.p1 TRINITY_DN1473_c0_g1~~TRINITY_DN1473_c0_g1_i1.p1  ORF type:complete len:210 (+),score=66.93 TRINITY_DN1473_c0_g1_i1:630-1259(+)
MTLNDDSILEKFAAQIDLLLSQSSTEILLEVLNTFQTIIPFIKPTFRDKYILEKLMVIGNSNQNEENDKVKTDVIRALIDAYRAFSTISQHKSSAEKLCNCLRALLEQAGPIEKPQISSLLNDLDLPAHEKQGNQKDREKEKPREREETDKEQKEGEEKGKETFAFLSTGGKGSEEAEEKRVSGETNETFASFLEKANIFDFWSKKKAN